MPGRRSTKRRGAISYRKRRFRGKEKDHQKSKRPGEEKKKSQEIPTPQREGGEFEGLRVRAMLKKLITFLVIQRVKNSSVSSSRGSVGYADTWWEPSIGHRTVFEEKGVEGVKKKVHPLLKQRLF